MSIVTFQVECPPALAKQLMQHMRDFEQLDPTKIHLKILADVPELSVPELVEAVKLDPELTFQTAIEREGSKKGRPEPAASVGIDPEFAKKVAEMPPESQAQAMLRTIAKTASEHTIQALSRIYLTAASDMLKFNGQPISVIAQNIRAYADTLEQDAAAAETKH